MFYSSKQKCRSDTKCIIKPNNLKKHFYPLMRKPLKNKKGFIQIKFHN